MMNGNRLVIYTIPLKQSLGFPMHFSFLIAIYLTFFNYFEKLWTPPPSAGEVKSDKID